MRYGCGSPQLKNVTTGPQGLTAAFRRGTEAMNITTRPLRTLLDLAAPAATTALGTTSAKGGSGHEDHGLQH